MGNKVSHPSKSDARIDILYVRDTILPPPPPVKERIVTLGISDVGKSTLFDAMKRLIPQVAKTPEISQEGLKIELQDFCSNIVGDAWCLMSETERRQFRDLLPIAFKTTFDWSIDEAYISQMLHDQFNCIDLLLSVWKIPYFREFYESVCRSERCSIFENVKELIFNIECKKIFHPHLLCHPRTTGIISFETKRENTKLEFFDVGGRRNERKKWIHCFDQVHTLIYVVSLSEYNQVLVEDNSVLRMNESIALFDELCKSQFLKDARKILIFTKPDILLKKLNQGIQYNRELNTIIRPELERISQHHEKVVVNSIVSEYLKTLKSVELDSYHIINTTSNEDIKSVIDMIFGEKSSQKTTFISHCLLAVNNRMQLMLFNNYLNGNLIDIQISTIDE